MAQIINLRQARKHKARADKEARAAENRIAFGRTKEERQLTQARRDLDKKKLDAHKRDDETPT
ncbi:DUF4169 family protein [Microvirga flavescens]|uniref:DUF4169 family protein n=1 Tax=Microvirga flavescens TaxID=2249811 RepID=UPI000DDC090B|nr:DUF4169 family protein [Microvirga flavescens]